MKRTAFKVGDRVAFKVGWGRDLVFVIDAIEIPDKPSLGVKLDMGRYTLRLETTVFFNQPGYLLRPTTTEATQEKARWK